MSFHALLDVASKTLLTQNLELLTNKINLLHQAWACALANHTWGGFVQGFVQFMGS